MHKRSDHVLSLFSGAGGFSHGFSHAGLKPVCGAEIDVAACKSYEENIGAACHNVDLSTINPGFFRDLLGGVPPLAIIGGPPCQGFSSAGPRKADDPRNQLIFNYLRIVASVQPRWFVFENVEGILTSGRGLDIASLVQEFISLGYCVRLEKVNFASYGVPQTRKRVIIVGNRLGANFDLPPEINSYDSGKSKKINGKVPAPTVDQALAGLGAPGRSCEAIAAYSSEDAQSEYDALMRVGNCEGKVRDHWDLTKNKDSIIYSQLEAGQTMRDLPEKFWHQSFRRRAHRRVMDGTPTEKRGGPPSGFKRLFGSRQSLTITGAASRELIHPHEHRPLTRRECARLQSFPDHYQFHGSPASIIQQIGNAVPPVAAAVLGKHLQTLDGQFGGAVGPTPKQYPPQLLGFVLTDSVGKSSALKRTEQLLSCLSQSELELA